MARKTFLRTLLGGSALSLLMVAHAAGQDFDIPAGDLKSALNQYTASTGVDLIYPADQMQRLHTDGARGNLSPDDALTRLLKGTGFSMRRAAGGIAIVHNMSSSQAEPVTPLTLAQAAPARAAMETVTVTSSKLGGADVQSIPISITALSQEQLTSSQTAGGPDLVKQVPNLTFTKTNFSGYSINIRGIGTQAISVTTDPAVAIALNDTPFIRNHFFEQEFYDLGQVEILRGPQGTLYGRNATAGVVNLTTAKPTDQFEAMASGELGNYHQRRLEGMINIPIVDDRLDIRVAGEWTKRQGYSFNENTDSRIDGRDLWSGRVTIGFKPIEDLQMYLVWEHFSEDDDRMRSAKQLCKNDPGLTSVDGVAVPRAQDLFNAIVAIFTPTQGYLSQGCLPASPYSADSFQVPNGYSLPYIVAAFYSGGVNSHIDPYASATQSRNLRVIQTQIDPIYKAKNDTIELNTDYNISPSLTFTSQTGFNHDFLWSTEDYNRFNTSPAVFQQVENPGSPRAGSPIGADGYFCDPQLGCSNRIVAQDLTEEHAWQLSQEFRLASKFAGPLNFSVGGNYIHYETEENYYVFSNAFTLFSVFSGRTQDAPLWNPTDPYNTVCRRGQGAAGLPGGYQDNDPTRGAGQPGSVCYGIDINPLTSLSNEGHNYFLSQNPYSFDSYAGFGEVYYDVAKEVKLTGGLRWTDDRKHFTSIPSELLAAGYGYLSVGTIDQSWQEFTGRTAVNWTPKLDFTDQTLVYASYAHGYKAGGANPPGATFYSYGSGAGTQGIPVHPLTFKPEFIDAFELGSKNMLFDGALTLNGSLFYYNYQDYQISEIVDRTSINLNVDAHVNGAELEASYEPLPGLRFNFAGGYEHTELAKGSQSVDLMDRTAGHSGWVVMKPFVSQPSNCIFPSWVVADLIKASAAYGEGNPSVSACGYAYGSGVDPITLIPYYAGPQPTDPQLNIQQQRALAFVPDYPGFNPATAPNGGAGFSKDLSGNELPNAPPLTVSAGAQYTMPITADWAGTLRADYYWQDYSWARIFNDNPYDRLRGYTNVNLTLIFTSQSGWQVMLYDKNVFDTTAITGTFLNSDDSGLTTNVFLTDPKLIGIRVTKNW